VAPAERPVIERRVGLARGPAHIVGTILLVAGLYLLYKQHRFPPLGNFPNGHAPVNGDVFFGIFGANGWTGMGTAIAGGLLLFASGAHAAAKTMSLIVGVILGAAAIIAAISGNVLGLAAANGWTEIGWGVCAVILLLNVLMPARRRMVEVTPVAGRRGDVNYTRRITGRRATEPVAEEPVATEPVERSGTEPVERSGTEPVERGGTVTRA
jgi:hypothetical protein